MSRRAPETPRSYLRSWAAGGRPRRQGPRPSGDPTPLARLEAVTVCCDYADCLALTRANAAQLDRWIVVTEARDRATRALCAEAGIEVVLTDRLRQGGAAFAKGRGINDGLAALSPRGWVLFLDADILLPADLRARLARYDLDPRCLYGPAARRQLFAPEDLAAPLEDFGVPPSDYQAEGPVGFCQLVHADTAPRYVEDSTTADHDDIEFVRSFAPENRVFLEGLEVGHLGEPEADHLGRVSPRFGRGPRLARWHQAARSWGRWLVRGVRRRLLGGPPRRARSSGGARRGQQVRGELSGVPVDLVTPEQAVARVLAARTSGGLRWAMIDRAALGVASHDASARDALRAADLVTVHGWGGRWAARRAGQALPSGGARRAWLEALARACRREGLAWIFDGPGGRACGVRWATQFPDLRVLPDLGAEPEGPAVVVWAGDAPGFGPAFAARADVRPGATWVHVGARFPD